MKVYALTIAFCPASQFARTIIEWRNTGNCMDIDKHIVVQGHYPINTAKNNRDIKLLSDSFGGLEFIDLGHDMGCAQIQTLMMRSFPDYDAFINVDPDSACETNWLGDAIELFEHDAYCIVASCFSPLVERFMASRKYGWSNCNAHVGIPQSPTPFNLSLWRNSFFREIGGVPQGGSKWGETEGGVWYHASRLGKYHAYLLDHMEDESGKLMQDRQLMEYKDAHLRSSPEDRFPGFFIEYLKWKHPDLVYLNTEIPENTQFQ